MLYLLHLQRMEHKVRRCNTKALAASQSIGIYYDGAFVSVPNVQAAITNGQAQISGNMTYEEADALASTIRIGGLKLELEELRSNVVGAQLGEQAVATSLKPEQSDLQLYLYSCVVYTCFRDLHRNLHFNLY